MGEKRQSYSNNARVVYGHYPGICDGVRRVTRDRVTAIMRGLCMAIIQAFVMV